ncbi:hypothetical protein GCM10027190_42950 [Spirosoma areae]
MYVWLTFSPFWLPIWIHAPKVDFSSRYISAISKKFKQKTNSSIAIHSQLGQALRKHTSEVLGLGVYEFTPDVTR